jgi:hypothetical protein
MDVLNHENNTGKAVVNAKITKVKCAFEVA